MPLDFTGYRDASPLTRVLDRLYLGGFANAESLAAHNPHGITCVLNCTAEPLSLPRPAGPHDPSGFAVFQMNQRDGEPWNVLRVHEALEWVRHHLNRGRAVLVHCHAGVSRSPVFVAAYLYTCGFDFDQALALIRGARPQVQPAPVILSSMKRIFSLADTDEVAS